MTDHAHEHRDCEVFTFLGWRWCIDLARQLAESEPDAATFYEKVTIGQLRGLLRLVHINAEHAATADLTQPIMVAPVHTDNSDDPCLLVLDGWHRVYRALGEDQTHLPALLITHEVEQAARLTNRAR